MTHWRGFVRVTKWPLFLLFMFAIGLWFFSAPRKGVTLSNVGRLRKGMTCKEVEILFGSEGHHCEDHLLNVRSLSTQQRWKAGGRNGVDVVVAFDLDQCKVINWGVKGENGSFSLADPEWRRPSLADELRSWLGW